jgi:hypothetical protein
MRTTVTTTATIAASAARAAPAHTRTRRSIHVVVVAVIAVFALPAARAAAAPPDQFHAHFLDTAQDVDLCGVNVDLVNEGVFSERVFTDNSGNFVRDMRTTSQIATFTADNGKSVTAHVALQVVSTEIANEAAGTLTVTDTVRGIPLMIKTTHGPVRLRDAGVMGITTTLDLATGEVISAELTFTFGPHPEADSGNTRSCEVISAALA